MSMNTQPAPYKEKSESLKPGMTVALLAYREADNLRVLLPKIRENVESIPGQIPYTIEVIDTKEPLDDTPEVCRQFGAEYFNQEGPGFGGAFRSAIRQADRKLFLILDSDGSHDPVYIPAIYQKYIDESCDLVIGSRYTKGGKTFDHASSILMSRTLNAVFRLFLGIKAKDISTDFRLYDTAQLKNVRLENVYFDVLQEVLLKLKINTPGLKIGEVPITFVKRMYGESKRDLIPFILSYLRTLVKLTGIRFLYGRRGQK